MTERVALVTGANRGIGAEIARQLGDKGLRVLSASREARAGAVKLDVTSAEDIAAVASKLRSEGGLDVLVNNAGVSLDGFDATVAQRTLDVNVYGAMHLTDALVPVLRPGARVVMVSSGMGALSGVRGRVRERFADPSLDRAGLLRLLDSFVSDIAAGRHTANGWSSNAYSVSKIAMNALVRVLAKELANNPRGILVNAENPGWVKTRMGGSSAPRTVAQGARTAVWLATLPEGGPSGGFFADERPIPW